MEQLLWPHYNCIHQCVKQNPWDKLKRDRVGKMITTRTLISDDCCTGALSLLLTACFCLALFVHSGDTGCDSDVKDVVAATNCFQQNTLICGG